MTQDTSGRRPGSPPPSTMLGGGEALRVAGVTKWYGGVQALDGVSLTVAHGEVVALVGDNGAGKSTLVNIVAGVIEADEGELYVEGQRASIGSANDAASYGISTVHQDQTLADNLSVVENLFLGRELLRGFGPFERVDFSSMRKRTNEVLSDLGISTISNSNAPVGQLSGGQRQSVAVGRVMLETYPVVMLDEPTAGLGVAECARVMDLVRRVRAQGTATLIVSQNIDEVFEVADRIVVLHLGRVGAVFNKTETTPEEVVGAVMGMA
jgi:ABC-type sugar transport system ATPase subunit